MVTVSVASGTGASSVMRARSKLMRASVVVPGTMSVSRCRRAALHAVGDFSTRLSKRAACAVVAGDFLDSTLDKRPTYVKDYRKALDMSPKLWGWHPYRDARNMQKGRLDKFLAATRCKSSGCRQPDVWLTEGNGVSVHPRPGGAPPDLRTTSQTADSLEHIIDLANDPDRPRVKRLYVYQWMGDDTWDSGLFRRNGTCRPTFNVLRRHSNPGLSPRSCPSTPN
jgi:hypothetical protein